MSELPEGWEISTIEELCILNPKHDKDLDDELEVSFIPMPAVSGISGNILEHHSRPLSEIRTGYTHFQNQDVLFAKITPCMENGKAAVAENLVNDIGCGSTEFFVLRSWGALPPRLLHRYVRQASFRNEARRNMAGAVGHARVPKDYLLSQKLPVPPAKEQKRIVTKLETCEARIDAAREALSDVPKLLEHYRKSVLAAAFRGHLTSNWRTQHPDAEPAEKLLQRLRDERRQRWEQAELEKFEAKGKAPPKNWKQKYKAPQPLTEAQLNELPELPEGWCWANWAEIAEVAQNLVSPLDYPNAPHIAPDNIEKETGRILTYNSVAKDKVKSNKNHFYPGQILYSKIRPYLNKCVCVDFEGLASADVYPINSHISRTFLHAYMLSPKFLKAVQESAGNRVVLPKVNQAQLGVVPVPVPSTKEQVEISRILQKHTRLLEAQVLASDETKEELETLTQSLLAKAFRGELVPQDPNDEPASKLLERITKAREAEE